MKMAKTYCPECDAVITLEDPELGAIFECPECEVALEVISAYPLDVYFHFGEEWEDEWNASWEDDEEEPDYDQ
jgi:lysine biosynthesis protein LysW